MVTVNVEDFEFSADSAARCNGNGTGDQEYIVWFCQEAVFRAEKANSQIVDIVTLRSWGEAATVRARLESSWALLKALQHTLDDLATAARLKPKVAEPFQKAAQRVASMIKRLEADYVRAASWFS
ncbi:hypothetical protein AU476_01415 [Cupriavidus sp. UYMSc13B]|nr:hypothetical protein AU476_01415 [Cupriavidus sp. UYMSc13B]